MTVVNLQTKGLLHIQQQRGANYGGPWRSARGLDAEKPSDAREVNDGRLFREHRDNESLGTEPRIWREDSTQVVSDSTDFQNDPFSSSGHAFRPKNNLSRPHDCVRPVVSSVIVQVL
jgi:hypothetical protein